MTKIPPVLRGALESALQRMIREFGGPQKALAIIEAYLASDEWISPAGRESLGRVRERLVAIVAAHEAEEAKA